MIILMLEVWIVDLFLFIMMIWSMSMSDSCCGSHEEEEEDDDDRFDGLFLVRASAGSSGWAHAGAGGDAREARASPGSCGQA
jgi:hypothetical protein